MKCVIFCGGKGTRMDKYSESVPKPLIPIGEKPILCYIMDHYANYGITDFILCLGHLGDKIKDYFRENPSRYNLELIDTGENSSKADRLLKIKDLIEGDFFVSYGDDLGDINLNKLIELHKQSESLATITAVHVENPYGVLDFNEFEPTKVEGFREKPIMKEWINGGYFLFSKKIFDYIESGEEIEKEVFNKLVKEGKISAHRHPGFWKSMNTIKDSIELNDMLQSGKLKEFLGGENEGE